MKAFRFKNKQQTNTYTIYTLIAAALSIFIFSGLDIYINKQVAYLLVTILSSISIMSAIRKANKEFEEIMIHENVIKFYFQNKIKEPLIIPKSKVSTLVLNETIEFSNEESKKVIGIAHKSKIESERDWENLIMYFQSSR